MATKEFRPFIDPKKTIPEFTLVPVLVGAVLGIIFGASSLYLALKVGMTVSASIPVAVLSITLFKGFSKVFGMRQATILENNITQTTGSAGESLAFGVAVTMPALLILGYDMELTRVIIVSVLGGLLGILMMIPLRRALIVDGHDTLPYPEGTACAEVLIAGEKGGTSAFVVFFGFFLGLGYKFANLGLRLWKDVAEKGIGFFKGATAAIEVSPELLGVGYIIGPHNSSVMVAGGVVSSFVLIPMIKLFGDGLTTPLYPATKLISEMAPHDVWRSYVLYIGAGAVAAAGIISLVRSLPTIIHGAKAGFAGLKSAGKKGAGFLRTDEDLPMSFVLIGCAALVTAIWLIPMLQVNLLGALLIVSFGFLFVTVSSQLTGEIGSSSNPISGMTVATLLLTCLVFVLIGWVGPEYRVTALSIAAIVCIAASNGGTTSQDLKTGYLVGGTPKYQQLAILVGAFTSALVIGYTLKALNDASTIYSKTAVPQGIVVDVSQLPQIQRAPDDKTDYHVLQLPETPTSGPLAKLQAGKYLVAPNGAVTYLVDPGINGVLKHKDDHMQKDANGVEKLVKGASVTKYEAPKARLMSLIIDGILTQKLPWGLVLLGVFIAIALELGGISSLAFAVGVYLPLSSSTPIFAGGMIAWIVRRLRHKNGKAESEEESESGPGVLFSSGLIAGGSIGGIALALVSVNEDWAKALDFSTLSKLCAESDLLPMIVFTALGLTLLKVATSKTKIA